MGVPPHQQDPILLFLHMFSPKSTCRRLVPPPTRVGAPQREILDMLLSCGCSVASFNKFSLFTKIKQKVIPPGSTFES